MARCTSMLLASLTLLLVLVTKVPAGQPCPRPCSCHPPAELHCTFRSLLSIPPGLPKHSRHINLGYNSISRIGMHSFSGLRRLELLMLHGNDIQEIPDTMFRDMGTLQVLKLSYNKLSHITAQSFSGLSSLLRLHLDHNRLRFLHPRALLQLPALRLLRLQGNQFHQLHPQAFCTLSLVHTFCLSTLRHLDISNNSLSGLPKNSLATAPLLETLGLQANPWSCDCRMAWLKPWSLKHPGVLKCPGGPQCPICDSPNNLKGRGLIQPTDLPCTSPVISSPHRDLPREEDHNEIQPIESWREQLGHTSLTLSDQQGNNVDLSCNVTDSAEIPDVTPADLSSMPISLSLSLSLDCPVERGNYERVWRLLAYYSETAVRLDREIMLSKPPRLAYRYRQAAEREGYYHTGVRASVTATPHWLMQPTLSLQLDRAQSGSRTVKLVLSTSVSAQPAPVPSVSSHAAHPWVLISTNHTPTALAAVTGSKVELACPILSSAKPNLQWVFPDGSHLYPTSYSSDGRIEVTTTGLILNRIQLSDAGLYHCVARVGKEVDVLPVRLAVEDSSDPTPGEQGAPAVIVMTGESVSLPCKTSGSPAAEVSWVLPDSRVVKWAGVAKESPSSQAFVLRDGSLSLPFPGRSSVGQYRCVAVNQHGVDALSTHLSLTQRQATPLQAFPRMSQLAARVSTRTPPTLAVEGSGYEEEKEVEEEERTPSVYRKRPRPAVPPQTRLLPSSPQYRRVPGGGQRMRIGPPVEQRRNRLEGRRRVNMAKHKIDPQKWADILAKIRLKTAPNATQPTVGPDATREPTAQPISSQPRTGRKGEPQTGSADTTEGSSIDDSILREEGLQAVHTHRDANIQSATDIETDTQTETGKEMSTFTVTTKPSSNDISRLNGEQNGNTSRTRPQNPMQGTFTNSVPTRPRRPWDARRRLVPRRRINRPGARLNPDLPSPDLTTTWQQGGATRGSTTARTSVLLPTTTYSKTPAPSPLPISPTSHAPASTPSPQTHTDRVTHSVNSADKIPVSPENTHTLTQAHTPTHTGKQSEWTKDVSQPYVYSPSLTVQPFHSEPTAVQGPTFLTPHNHREVTASEEQTSESSTEPRTEPTAKPATEHTTDMNTEPMTESIIEQTSEPTIEPKTQFITATTTKPTTVPTTLLTTKTAVHTVTDSIASSINNAPTTGIITTELKPIPIPREKPSPGLSDPREKPSPGLSDPREKPSPGLTDSIDETSPGLPGSREKPSPGQPDPREKPSPGLSNPSVKPSPGLPDSRERLSPGQPDSWERPSSTLPDSRERPHPELTDLMEKPTLGQPEPEEKPSPGLLNPREKLNPGLPDSIEKPSTGLSDPREKTSPGLSDPQEKPSTGLSDHKGYPSPGLSDPREKTSPGLLDSKEKPSPGLSNPREKFSPGQPDSWERPSSTLPDSRERLSPGQPDSWERPSSILPDSRERPHPELTDLIEKPTLGLPEPEEKPSPGLPNPREKPSPGLPNPREKPNPGLPDSIEKFSPGQPDYREKYSPGLPDPSQKPSPGVSDSQEKPSPGLPNPREKPSPGQPDYRERHSPGLPDPREKPSPGLTDSIEKPSPGQPDSIEKPSPGLPDPREKPSPGLSDSKEKPSPGLSDSKEKPSPGLTDSIEKPSPGQPDSQGRPNYILPDSRERPHPELTDLMEKPTLGLPEPEEKPSPGLLNPREKPSPGLPNPREKPSPGLPNPREKPNPRLPDSIEKFSPGQPDYREKYSPGLPDPSQKPSPGLSVSQEKPSPGLPDPREKPSPRQPDYRERHSPGLPDPREKPSPGLSDSEEKPSPGLTDSIEKPSPGQPDSQGRPNYILPDSRKRPHPELTDIIEKPTLGLPEPEEKPSPGLPNTREKPNPRLPDSIEKFSPGQPDYREKYSPGLPDPSQKPSPGLSVSQEKPSPGLPDPREKPSPGLSDSKEKPSPGLTDSIEKPSPGQPDSQGRPNYILPDSRERPHPELTDLIEKPTSGLPEPVQKPSPGLPNPREKSSPGLSDSIEKPSPGLPDSRESPKPGLPNPIDKAIPGLPNPKEKPSPGLTKQDRQPPVWTNLGVNTIPDSHGSRPRFPFSSSLPVSPGLQPGPQPPLLRARPRIAPPHIRSMSVPAGSRALLPCPSAGEPTPVITWTKVSTGAAISVGSRGQRFEVLPNGTFIIRSVQLQDRGTYICSAENTLGRDRMLLTLEVWTRPPRMQLTNYREVTVHQGGEVELECQADGVPAPLLSWVLPNRSVLTFDPSLNPDPSKRVYLQLNGTLHVSAVLPGDRGVYRCVASNSAGTASTSVRLHVSSLPPVIQQVSEEVMQLPAGLPVYAHCSARGAPPPALRWRIPDGTLVRPSQFLRGNLFIFPNGTLLIRSLIFQDAGSYECTASNAVGSDKRTVRVEVTGGKITPAIHGKSSPLLPASPSNKTRIPIVSSSPHGSSIFNNTRLSPFSPLYPASPKSPSPPLSPSSPLNNTQVAPSSPHSPSSPQSPSSPLSPYSPLSPSQPQSPSPPLTNSRVSPSLPYSPSSPLSKAKIISTSPPSGRVTYGSSVMLHCSTSGSPQPTVIWRTPSRKLADINFSFDWRIKVFANGSLSIQAVTEKDGGDYLCVARNKVGDDFRLLRVTVVTKPAKIEYKQPSNQKVSYGEALKVDCQASGLPDPAVRWSLPDGTMVNSVLQGADRGGRTRRLVVFDNGTLFLSAVGMKEEGEYTCYAENQGGTDQMKVRVRVLPSPPSFPGQSSYEVISVRPGGAVTLRCGVKGEPLPTITWLSPANRVITRGSWPERILVVSDGSLVIQGARGGDGGNYTCRASNAGGVNSRVMGLQVQALNPTFTGPGRGETHILINGQGASRDGTGVSSRDGSSVGNGRVPESSARYSRVQTGVISGGVSGDSIQAGDQSSRASVNRGAGMSARHKAVIGQTVLLPCPTQKSPVEVGRLTWQLPGNGVIPVPFYGSRMTVHRNGSLELRGVRESDAGILVCVVSSEGREERLQVHLEVLKAQEIALYRVTNLPERTAPRALVTEKPAPRSLVTERPAPRTLDTVKPAPRALVTEKPAQRVPVSELQPASGDSVLPESARPRGLVPKAVEREQPVVVSSRSASLVSIINGENLHLPCPPVPGFSLGPQVTLSWTLPSGVVLSRGQSGGSGRLSVMEDGTLTVLQASVYDRGSYSCRSTNQNATSVLTVPVIVIAYPPRITSGPSPLTYTRPGVAVQLTCLAIATPRATITWETPDQSQLQVTGQARVYGNRYLSSQGALIIQNPSSQDTGFYRCTARNVIGTDTKATYLHVI